MADSQKYNSKVEALGGNTSQRLSIADYSFVVNLISLSFSASNKQPLTINRGWDASWRDEPCRIPVSSYSIQLFNPINQK